MKTTVKHVRSGGPDREWEGLEEDSIKHLETKLGEVWLLCGKYPVMITETGYVYFDSYSGRQNIGDIHITKIPTLGDKYSAPSVEAYYARKFLNDAKQN